MIADIIIRPSSGAFDLEQLRTRLEQQPHTVLDPIDGRVYMLTSSAVELELALSERNNKRTSFPYIAILVSMVESELHVSYQTSDVEPAREFVVWLRDHYDLLYLDEEFNDLTAAVDDRLEYVFGPKPSPQS